MPDDKNGPKDKSEDKTSPPQTDVATVQKDVEAKPPEKEKEKEKGKEPEIFPLPDDMPPEMKRSVSLMMAQMQRGPIPHPIYEKITSEHITKLIDTSDKDSERGLKDTSQRRRYSMLFAILIAAVFIFLVVYLRTSDPELLKSLIGYLIAFAGGVGTGYGYKAWRDKR